MVLLYRLFPYFQVAFFFYIAETSWMCASDFECMLYSFLTIIVYLNTKYLQFTDSKSCSPPSTGLSVGAYIALGVGVPCLIIFILGFLWFCGFLPSFCQRRKGDHCFLTLLFFAFDMECFFCCCLLNTSFSYRSL